MESIFVWRPVNKTIDLDSNDLIDIEELPLNQKINEVYKMKINGNIRCFFCNNKISVDGDLFCSNSSLYKYCRTCGWGREIEFDFLADSPLIDNPFNSSLRTVTMNSTYRYHINTNITDEEEYILPVRDGIREYMNLTENILKIFDINSPLLCYEELGNYLRKNFKYVNSLSSRRMELLVADIFKNQKYNVIVTQASHDEGKDLIILNRNNKQLVIVEIKRRKGVVGVDLIRQLRGVQVNYNHKKAILITNGHFSSFARKEALSNHAIKRGFVMELKDAEDLLRMLEVYKHNKTLAFELQKRANKYNRDSTTIVN